MSDGSTVVYDINNQTLPIINSANSIDKTNCDDGQNITQIVFSMSLETKGMRGSYEEYSDGMASLLNGAPSRKRRQAEDTSQGISNPIVCLEQSQVLLMEVDNNRFPIYDNSSLINSNDDFDFGGFRLLQEEQELMQD